ncbi:MAG: hypothetical protein IPJ40_18915 [Saprospirales bacterium]|nr:hypothetical protein [Saprospirales bacterium]
MELLRDGKTISSNIILMGEKGITDQSYIRYQKAELVDAVFLQQNSFHEVDGVTTPDRLRLMFDLVKEVVDSPITIEGKKKYSLISISSTSLYGLEFDEGRRSEGFERQKSKILHLVKQGGYVKENV